MRQPTGSILWIEYSELSVARHFNVTQSRDNLEEMEVAPFRSVKPRLLPHLNALCVKYKIILIIYKCINTL